MSSLRRTAVPERVAKDDGFVWKLPGFNMSEFYAAAEYIRRHEKNQGLRPANKTQKSTNIKATPVEQDMLDKLALLFARVKTSGRPPEHVTATALKKGKAGLEIWIAKNDGPKDKDEGFRADLEVWFNQKGSWCKDAGLMDREIRSFWGDRLQFYVSKIKTLWRSMCKGPKPSTSNSSPKIGKIGKWSKDVLKHVDSSSDRAEGLNSSYKALTELFGDEIIDLNLFKQDWDDINAICSKQNVLQQILTSPDNTVIPPDLGRDSYAVVKLDQPGSHLDLARDFSKLLRVIGLLKTVERAIQAFVLFREQLPHGTRVFLRFLAPLKSLDLDPKMCTAFADTLARWRESTNNRKFNNEVEGTEIALRKQEDFRRYFHCELQILDHFLDDVEACDYIGCSKLSCYMCWGVLQGTGFRTRDTHANLWPACAFPFSVRKGGDSGSRYELLLALKRTHDHVVEKALRRALDSSFDFADGASLAETEPGGDLKRRPKPLTSMQDIGSGYLEQMTRTRAIHIPVDGPPRSQIVEFQTFSRRPPNGFNEVARPLAWKHIPSSQEVYSEQRGATRVSIQVCVQSYDPHITTQLPINLWYKDLISAFHQQTYDDAKDHCRWRGDLYVFRMVNGQLDAIDKEEMQEVVQLCRDALAATKVCILLLGPLLRISTTWRVCACCRDANFWYRTGRLIFLIMKTSTNRLRKGRS